MMESCELTLFLARIAAELRALPKVTIIDGPEEVHVKASRIEAIAQRAEDASERFRPCAPRRKKKDA